MTLERILLQTIKFDLMVEHPYAYLLRFAKLIKGNLPEKCIHTYRWLSFLRLCVCVCYILCDFFKLRF